MAVHAYRALESLTQLQVQYSYLDARKLELQITGYGVSTITRIPDPAKFVHIPLTKLFELHGLTKLIGQMSYDTRWPQVMEALIKIHGSSAKAKTWRDWCSKNLRSNSNFASGSDFQSINVNDLPFPELSSAFRAEYPDRNNLLFQQLISLGAFQTTKHETTVDQVFAKWLDGVWLEEFVFNQLQVLKNTDILSDLAMTIRHALNEEEKPPEFEFDVACVRGYQLFACSVTTSNIEKLCRSKLIEALIRAEQLGGSEARVALICCADTPDRLRDQVSKLFHQSRLRVFGRPHLPNLQRHLSDWIHEQSHSQESV